MNFRLLCQSPDASIRDAMRNMSDTSVQLVLVSPDKRQLLGTVTDGDIRRALLNDVPLTAPLSQIMKKKPVVAPESWNHEQILRLALSSSIRQIPIVDQDGILQDIFFLEDIFREQEQTPVVIMAGGLGTRLGSLTTSLPKPMIQIGNAPILEHIVASIHHHGFKKFYFSVNYLAEVIQRYFKDGASLGVQISYTNEDEPLGTAGSLRLMRDHLNQSSIIMNGDLLTDLNFKDLLSFHRACGADMTLCVREFQLQVPYGVVYLNGSKVERIEEKPVHNHYVSAGIYVIEPSVLNLIPEQGPFDIPQLLEATLNKGLKTVSFPIKGYWRDLGTPEDLKKAEDELTQISTLKPHFSGIQKESS